MNALQRHNVPPCLHAKLDTTARKPERAAYPAQMLKLHRTHEFPEIVCIGRCTPICGMATNRLSTAGPSSSGPRGRQGRPAARPPSPARAGIGLPFPVGRSGPWRRRTRARRGIVALVRAGSDGSRNHWSLAGTSGHARHATVAGHTACTVPTSAVESMRKRLRIPT
jgi:hypothetical protein